jgi:hypothetical protein
MSRAAIHKNERGYALAVLMVFTTVLLVGLTTAEINWQQAMQREREEELIFRGKQYMRAIMLWKRKFPGPATNPLWGPTSIDALLNTNNFHFLRKRWKDPMTNSDQWRIIRVGGQGAGLAGGKVQGAPSFGPSPTASTTGSGSNLLGSKDSGQSSLLPILGVASSSEKESLKTVNGRNKYSEWEFVYTPNMAVNWSTGPGSASPAMPATTPGPSK